MNEQDLYEPAGPEASAPAPVTIIDLPPTPEAEEPVVEPIAAAPAGKGRPGWLLPAAVGAIGLIAAGTLGGLLYQASGQRDLARHQLAATSATLATTRNSLADTQDRLTQAQAAAAAQAATDRYVNLFVTDDGKLQVDYDSMNKACVANDWTGCRSGAQQTLADAQKFQADRDAAQVPNSLAPTDGMLKDSLSAAIASMQEIISGADNGKVDQVDDGSNKFNDALLGIAKAESSLAAAAR